MQDSTLTSIGIDFGGTSVKLGVCRGGELLCTDEPIPTADFVGPEALISEMARRASLMRKSYPDIMSIGVGVPGLVDFERGYVHELTNVPGWKHVPLKSILSEKTGLPTLVENDANVPELGEGSEEARVIAGDPACSLLVERLVSSDPKLQMPPGNPLSAAERCALVQWIEKGATR